MGPRCEVLAILFEAPWHPDLRPRVLEDSPRRQSAGVPLGTHRAGSAERKLRHRGLEGRAIELGTMDDRWEAVPTRAVALDSLVNDYSDAVRHYGNAEDDAGSVGAWS